MKRNCIVLFCALAALSACSKSEPATSSAETNSAKQAEAVQRYPNLHISGDPEFIDPGLVNEDGGSTVALGTYDGLVEYPEQGTGQPVPSLATHWKLSKDQKVWTFFLRKGALWSDGQPITAHDFVYSWRRVVDPSTASSYAFALYYVKNGKPINQGKITDLSELGVRALDEHTLEVTLENPTPYFLDLLGYIVFRPVPRWVVEKYGNKWTRPENIVSSGPFLLKEWVSGQRVTLVKNPKYWDADAVQAEQINVHIVESEDTALRMYMAGELDMVDELPAVKLAKLKDHPHYRQTPLLGTYFYTVNTEREPFTNMRVRQALAYAIDRKLLTEKYLHGVDFPSSGFVSLGIDTYDYPAGPVYDVTKAQALLTEAGYPNGEGFPEVTLSYNTLEKHKLIAQVVQQMWKENLGITIKLQNEEFKSLLKRYRAMDYQIGRRGWLGDYPDPMTFLEIMLSDSTKSNTGWKNAEYDALVERSTQEPNEKKRMQLLQEAEKILLAELPVVPIFTYGISKFVRPSLQNYHLKPIKLHPLKRIHIKEEQ